MGDQKNKVFVGGISWATDEKKFGEYFGTYGEITDCVIMRNLDTGNSRGFGFVTFADPACVEKLLETTEHVIDGKKLDIKLAVPRDEIGRAPDAPEPKNRRTSKIFVGGITLETSKADLEEYFGKYGTIVEASVMVDRVSGRPRGFGFVAFQSEDVVDTLLLDKHEICGRKVECKKAVPREETAELPKSRARTVVPPMRFEDRRSGYDPRDRRPPYFDDPRRFNPFPFDRRGADSSRGYSDRSSYPSAAKTANFMPPTAAYAPYGSASYEPYSSTAYTGGGSSYTGASSSPSAWEGYSGSYSSTPYATTDSSSYGAGYGTPSAYSSNYSSTGTHSTASSAYSTSQYSNGYGTGGQGYGTPGGQGYGTPGGQGYGTPGGQGYGAVRPAAATKDQRFRPY